MRRLLAIPVAWLLAFMVVPILLIAVFAFSGRSAYGGVEPRFSTEGVEQLFQSTTLALLLRSLWIAALATALCLLFGYPLAWFIATSRRKNVLLLLVMIPFWTNFLVRMYALRYLLSPEGFLSELLGVRLLDNVPAVLLGLVHGYLPFMVLPLYTAMERLPKNVLEAATDLGATPATRFLTVILPLTRPGIMAGAVLVFIPCFGAFVTPEVLGGEQVRLVGSMINHHFSASGDWPRGSALALVVTLVMAAMLYGFFRSRKTEDLA